MSWQTDMTTIVRYLISDVDDSNYKFTDARIQTSILVAATFVNNDIDFSNEYTINLGASTLSPDPTDSATEESVFVTLTCLKTACVIIGGEIRLEAGNSIAIKDGPSAVDLRGVSSVLVILHKDLCAKYDSAVLDYSAGKSIAGHAVLGPYSPGSDFVRRTYSDPDLRGGYFRN
jgi:hypothetical protein